MAVKMPHESVLHFKFFIEKEKKNIIDYYSSHSTKASFSFIFHNPYEKCRSVTISSNIFYKHLEIYVRSPSVIKDRVESKSTAYSIFEYPMVVKKI